ncbi:SH2 domain-containing protein A-like isoform X2 [Diospyros lotus]|uniref:SH2 domain-containing protein A-like isoform X2 n=1 Tax=Diospyros lotus TaxID=55363 RepID=UPI00224E9057|nr:SH2 domain-containing protein A-like isoform X2 [Diospyros lotus]
MSSSPMKEKSNSSIHLLSESPPCQLDDGSSELRCNIVHEGNSNPSSRQVKFGQDNSFATYKADLNMDRAKEKCFPHNFTANERLENHEVTDNSPSDSEGTGARNPDTERMSDIRNPVSDLIVFKYCLGGLNERALLLKEISSAASQKELENLAQLVSLYLGCSHHGRQIIIAKALVEEGTKVWDLISQNNNHVLWVNVASVIKQQFIMIAHCSSRSLTQLDLELLRKIAGCQELVAREHFEKLWCWLYPVAYTLSIHWVNSAWNSTSPKWIEGFITKEEAEYSLQGPAGLQDPGTFILRFPTSRSWPHPDAGNLVVTYIGSDYKIHHRMLSLDFIFSAGEKEKTWKPLKDMLLAEPELSRLGRFSEAARFLV